MEKDINELLLKQKSIERIVETKFHNLDNKVTEVTTTVNQLKQKVHAVPFPGSYDKDERPTLPVQTQFRTQARSAIVYAQDVRPSVSGPATTFTVPPCAPPVSNPRA
ncbi:hypothetical protein D1007_30865 [Hordeum vulgare]|nr:hypothetical protein D1007_30865 [Hordeum vulgare]